MVEQIASSFGAIYIYIYIHTYILIHIDKGTVVSGDYGVFRISGLTWSNQRTVMHLQMGIRPKQKLVLFAVSQWSLRCRFLFGLRSRS